MKSMAFPPLPVIAPKSVTVTPDMPAGSSTTMPVPAEIVPLFSMPPAGALADTKIPVRLAAAVSVLSLDSWPEKLETWSSEMPPTIGASLTILPENVATLASERPPEMVPKLKMLPATVAPDSEIAGPVGAMTLLWLSIMMAPFGPERKPLSIMAPWIVLRETDMPLRDAMMLPETEILPFNAATFEMPMPVCAVICPELEMLPEKERIGFVKAGLPFPDPKPMPWPDGATMMPPLPTRPVKENTLRTKIPPPGP